MLAHVTVLALWTASARVPFITTPPRLATTPCRHCRHTNTNVARLEASEAEHAGDADAALTGEASGAPSEEGGTAEAEAYEPAVAKNGPDAETGGRRNEVGRGRTIVGEVSARLFASRATLIGWLARLREYQLL